MAKPNYKKLLEAITSNDVPALARFCTRHGDAILHCGQVMGDSLVYPMFHHAAKEGATDCITFMLERGVDINTTLYCQSPEQDKIAEGGFIPSTEGLPPFPINALVWPMKYRNLAMTEFLLSRGISPDGPRALAESIKPPDGDMIPSGWPTPIEVLLRQYYWMADEEKQEQTEVTKAILRKILEAGADPNRNMFVMRWSGYPLAFALRVIGDKDFCDILLDHKAELFGDDIRSFRGAQQPDITVNPRLAYHIMRRLHAPNKRYAWGVALSAFMVSRKAVPDRDRLAILRGLIDAGADPTLAFNTSALDQHIHFYVNTNSEEEEKAVIKCGLLSGLANILEVLTPLEAAMVWPSGMTLAQAWDDKTPVSVSLTEGGDLIARKRSGRFAQVSMLVRSDDRSSWCARPVFAGSDNQDIVNRHRKIVDDILTPNGFEARSDWAYVKWIDKHRGHRVQFLHDEEDTMVISYFDKSRSTSGPNATQVVSTKGLTKTAFLKAMRLCK
jgi:hypothetical protein